MAGEERGQLLGDVIIWLRPGAEAAAEHHDACCVAIQMKLDLAAKVRDEQGRSIDDRRAQIKSLKLSREMPKSISAEVM